MMGHGSRKNGDWPSLWRRTLLRKVRKDRCRRGGLGVNKNSGRSPKSFLLRPWPTGGSASRLTPNSPKNSPDARLFGSMLGGGRSHDVEALRNMMTEAVVRSSGASGARGRGGGLRREEHPFEQLPDVRRLVLFRALGWIHQRTCEPHSPPLKNAQSAAEREATALPLRSRNFGAAASLSAERTEEGATGLD